MRMEELQPKDLSCALGTKEHGEVKGHDPSPASPLWRTEFSLACSPTSIKVFLAWQISDLLQPESALLSDSMLGSIFTIPKHRLLCLQLN